MQKIIYPRGKGGAWSFRNENTLCCAKVQVGSLKRMNILSRNILDGSCFGRIVIAIRHRVAERQSQSDSAWFFCRARRIDVPVLNCDLSIEWVFAPASGERRSRKALAFSDADHTFRPSATMSRAALIYRNRYWLGWLFAERCRRRRDIPGKYCLPARIRPQAAPLTARSTCLAWKRRTYVRE